MALARSIQSIVAQSYNTVEAFEPMSLPAQKETKQGEVLSHGLSLNRKFCVAPMMARTNRHCRYLMRLLTRHAMLYTEMVVDRALLNGNTGDMLAHHGDEHPVGFQVGGSDPDNLAACATEVERAGFDEINLNVGCPSSRAQAGEVGACLMRKPELVAECVSAMAERVRIPVTVKCRIGVDDEDDYGFLRHFIELVSRAGVNAFIVHARKALLTRTPKHNLRVPSLQYDYVWRLKNDFPELEFILNGGLTSLQSAKDSMRDLDGVMLGRSAYENMRILALVDELFYDDPGEPVPGNNVGNAIIANALEQYAIYALQECRKEGLRRLMRPVVGLMRGLPGAASLRGKLLNIGTPEEIEPAIGNVISIVGRADW